MARVRDGRGAEHTCRSGVSSSHPGFAVGDSIRIWFDRNTPSDCGVLSFGQPFGAGWRMIVAAVAIWLGAWGWYMGSHWMETAVPGTVPETPAGR